MVGGEGLFRIHIHRSFEEAVGCDREKFREFITGPVARFLSKSLAQPLLVERIELAGATGHAEINVDVAVCRR